MYSHTMRKGGREITIEVIEHASGFKVRSTLRVLAQIHTMTSDCYRDLNKATLAAFEQVNFQRSSRRPQC